jgi:predicted metal-dependent HD superfamily phosphohydrolase
MDLDPWWPGLLSGQTQVRERLIEAYDDPARGYHDLQHLAEVFARLDELMPVDDPERDTVLLAAWFHDAVYDSGTSAGDTNEERSAIMAERELATADAPPLLVDEVARLVRLTEHHRPAPGDVNGQLLCDADLAILAAGPDRYREYVAGVRAEYAEVPEEAFRAGRLAILEDLLAKESLFHTPLARERWEATARENLRAEVSALSAAS